MWSSQSHHFCGSTSTKPNSALLAMHLSDGKITEQQGFLSLPKSSPCSGNHGSGPETSSKCASLKVCMFSSLKHLVSWELGAALISDNVKYDVTDVFINHTAVPLSLSSTHPQMSELLIFVWNFRTPTKQKGIFPCQRQKQDSYTGDCSGKKGTYNQHCCLLVS